MANNHALDFGQAIYDDTAAVLDGAGIGHAGEGEGVLYTTDNGLVVGIYAVHNGHYPDANAVAQAVRDLKEAGAEIVVVSAHWGNEASYYQNENQTAVAHAAIDAGASIVVGHGPHRLQPMEEYNGGVIFYSLSNWVFGGNTLPADMDTVIGQVTIRRDLDGTLSVDSFQAIPCRISSRTDTNDYCPTLLEEGSEEYARALSKVTGEWTGSNDVIDYSFMHPGGGLRLSFEKSPGQPCPGLFDPSVLPPTGNPPPCNAPLAGSPCSLTVIGRGGYPGPWGKCRPGPALLRGARSEPAVISCACRWSGGPHRACCRSCGCRIPA